ncbi:unnamed protein product [Citrullus colocynthis]|uniref:Rho GDP-dissociation inhibitor n=1 Tax=Citrullus colocynthis TaxID=252529 RepID=A0ABP0YWF0_9ROSI
MSTVVGSVSSKDVNFNPQVGEEEVVRTMNHPQEEDQIIIIQEYDEDNILKLRRGMDLGPQFSLKEQLDKDKDDESLRKWKERLLGSVDLSAIGESKEAEVKILSLTIQCPGREDLVLPLPFTKTSKSSSLFSLKEGSPYRLRFNFFVAGNIVSGLKYTNTVWKTGVKVDHTKKMLGTFSPQKEPYVYEMEEETTPSGMFARGSYSARTKFVDDDGKCYLDVSYHFEIQKNWATPS